MLQPLCSSNIFSINSNGDLGNRMLKLIWGIMIQKAHQIWMKLISVSRSPKMFTDLNKVSAFHGLRINEVQLFLNCIYRFNVKYETGNSTNNRSPSSLHLRIAKTGPVCWWTTQPWIPTEDPGASMHGIIITAYFHATIAQYGHNSKSHMICNNTTEYRTSV